MIINALKNKIFPLSSEQFPDYKGRDEDESDDEFYTPRELEAIPEHSRNILCLNKKMKNLLDKEEIKEDKD